MQDFQHRVVKHQNRSSVKNMHPVKIAEMHVVQSSDNIQITSQACQGDYSLKYLVPEDFSTPS
jgi:hypothetical protein